MLHRTAAVLPLLATALLAPHAAHASEAQVAASAWLAFTATLVGGAACSVGFVALAQRSRRTRLSRLVTSGR